MTLSNTAFDHIMQAFNVILDIYVRGELGSRWRENDQFILSLEGAAQLAFDELNDEKGEEPFPAYTMGRDPITLDAIRDEAPE
jgi:hypothetical protein